MCHESTTIVQCHNNISPGSKNNTVAIFLNKKIIVLSVLQDIYQSSNSNILNPFLLFYNNSFSGSKNYMVDIY